MKASQLEENFKKTNEQSKTVVIRKVSWIIDFIKFKEKFEQEKLGLIIYNTFQNILK